MLLEAERSPVKSRADPAFLADVLAGLGSRPRAIPARWFYDERGSQLFEEITRLPEYYPTRTETALLRRHGSDITALTGYGRAVVEFGSGSSTKTPLLLSAVQPAAYVPVDISGDFLRASAATLGEVFPGLPVMPIEGDFSRPLALPHAIANKPCLGFFPGSTIGNFVPDEAVDLLRGIADTLGKGAMLLIGIDRIKSPDILIPAYDDPQGVTAAFNLNLLDRINHELEGDIPKAGFVHRAVWNDRAARIEMHLEALEDLSFVVAGHRFAIATGETIHTENSHKYGPRDAALLLRAGGWTPLAEWGDAENQFLMILAEAAPPHIAP